MDEAVSLQAITSYLQTLWNSCHVQASHRVVQNLIA